ncbi:MAG TPA: hypothetical protein VHD56_15500 [Tepidisphaeraceae bacterium]|nr:hypothetical protein [Tepidisphaeraceae bacterium]
MQQQAVEPKQAEKRPYVRLVLIEHGPVAEITSDGISQLPH